MPKQRQINQKNQIRHTSNSECKNSTSLKMNQKETRKPNKHGKSSIQLTRPNWMINIRSNWRHTRLIWKHGRKSMAFKKSKTQKANPNSPKLKSQKAALQIKMLRKWRRMTKERKKKKAKIKKRRRARRIRKKRKGLQQASKKRAIRKKIKNNKRKKLMARRRNDSSTNSFLN